MGNPGLRGAADSFEKSKAARQHEQDMQGSLKIFTTMLKAQNPLDGMKDGGGDKIYEQYMQMNGVQQNIEQTHFLKELSDQIGAMGKYIYTLVLGKEVEVDTSKKQFNGDSVVFYYDIPEISPITNRPNIVNNSTVNILDKNNHIVYSAQGETSAKQHAFVWNGRSNSNELLAKGEYKIEVTTFDQHNNALRASSTIKEKLSTLNVANYQDAFITQSGKTVLAKDIVSVSNDTQDPINNAYGYKIPSLPSHTQSIIA
jgi:flagellar hook assembly protein FlgD